MATASIAAPTFATVAELLGRLGDIPPERIRLQPTPGFATEDDVISSRTKLNRHCELVDGILVAKPVGYYESRLAAVLIWFLEGFLEKHDLGIVLGESGMIRVDPGQVRLPDVSFISWDHFPDRVLPQGSILDTSPDLAVEILSPSNTKKEMARKRQEYFASGTVVVWEVDPEKRTVRVYQNPTQSRLVKEDQILDGGDVLPGFKLPIRKWFARAGKRR